MDPASPAARLSRYLAADERLVWSGRPPQGLLLRPVDAFAIPFSLFFCGFTIFWEVLAFRDRAPTLFRFIGIPFILVGLHLVFGRFAVDLLQRRRTVYGVTTDRVLILSGVLRETVVCLPLRGIAQTSLTLRPDGSGDVVFGPRSPFENFLIPGWPGTDRFRPTAFEGIPGAQGVYDLVNRQP